MQRAIFINTRVDIISYVLIKTSLNISRRISNFKSVLIKIFYIYLNDLIIACVQNVNY